jgi:hypothetical protein
LTARTKNRNKNEEISKQRILIRNTEFTGSNQITLNENKKIQRKAELKLKNRVSNNEAEFIEKVVKKKVRLPTTAHSACRGCWF